LLLLVDTPNENGIMRARAQGLKVVACFPQFRRSHTNARSSFAFFKTAKFALAPTRSKRSNRTTMADAALVAEDREDKRTGFIRGLGLLDSTMIVAGSMIGSGIFIVSADIARQVGAPGWLLVVWIITGLLTLMAALSYGELAAMMPKAGGQYVYLREAFSPLWGFLYGWTLFLVIQTGTIAAGAVHANFGNLWAVRGTLEDVGKGLTAASAFGLFVGICVAQTNSLFSADAWNNITFTAGEVKDPRRNIPLSLAFGTFLVIALY